jgi:hypothetical protein
MLHRGKSTTLSERTANADDDLGQPIIGTAEQGS